MGRTWLLENCFLLEQSLQLRILSNIITDIIMAYLEREQSISAWATIVTGQQVTSLRKIKQAQFISLLLSKLDNNYFAPIFKSFPPEHFTISQLYKQITKYYKTEIGTNISQLLGEEFNFYSSSSIEDAWELMLGIATKGNNRQYNINQILKMDGKYQEELGRIVSKVINMFGGNVSSLDSGPNRASSGFYEQNNDIFFQISQENQQLKEKIDEYEHEIAQLKENSKNLRKQLEKEGRLKKSLLEVMISEDTQISSYGYSKSDHVSNEAAIVDFFRDVLNENSRKNRELSRKDEKLQNYEETVKDLKLAYSTILLELEQSRKIASQSNTQVYNQESELEQLRKQIHEYMDREKQWIEKIEELNEQKFYLKGIVERLQKQSNFTPEKIEQLVALKIKEKEKSIQNIEGEHPDHNLTNNLMLPKIRIPQSSTISEAPQQRKTVKYDIDQCKEPSLKNKLQREVSHLQKKINSLTSQNFSLKKLNSVLEKVINDFTADSQKLVNRIENEYEPMVEQLEKKVKEIAQNGIEEGKQKEKQFDEVLEQIMEAFKEKIDLYIQRQREDKEIIRKLEIERGAFLDQLRQRVESVQIKDEVKPLKISGQHKLEIKAEKLDPEPQPQKKQQQSISNESQEDQSEQAPVIMISQPTLQPPPKQTNFLSTPAVSLTIPNSKPDQLMGSIIVHEQEEEPHLGMRPRQYSYMQNRNSCIQDQFNFAQKGSQMLSKVESSCYMDIKEDIEDSLSQYDENMESGEIIDVTEMQEELDKIKNKYMKIAQRNNQLYERIISEYECIKNEKQKAPRIQVGEVLQKMNKVTSEKNQQGLGIRGKDLKDVEQYIKMCHQNKALKVQLSSILKQRNSLLTKLSSLQSPTQLPSKPQNQELLQKSYTLIRQLQQTLKKTTHQYLQLHNYFTNEQNLSNDSEKQSIIDRQEIQIAQLEQQIEKRSAQVEMVLEENKLMLSVMLQWRNLNHRNMTKKNLLERSALKKKTNIPKREESSNNLEIVNRSRNRTINQSSYLKN